MLVTELNTRYNDALTAGATPEQASNRIQENMNDIADRAFRRWEVIILEDVRKLNPTKLANLQFSD